MFRKLLGGRRSATGKKPNHTRPVPTSAEFVHQARANPNGWVYEINADAGYDAFGEVPPEAIEGAWKVNEHGEIVEPFIPNPNFDPTYRKPHG